MELIRNRIAIFNLKKNKVQGTELWVNFQGWN